MTALLLRIGDSRRPSEGCWPYIHTSEAITGTTHWAFRNLCNAISVKCAATAKNCRNNFFILMVFEAHWIEAVGDGILLSGFDTWT